MKLRGRPLVIASFDRTEFAGIVAGMELGIPIYQPAPRESLFDAIKNHSPVCVILSVPVASLLSKLVADIQRQYPNLGIVVVYRISETAQILPDTVKLLDASGLNGLSLIAAIHDTMY